MRILIAAIHYPVASGRYIARAFKRLGHDVRTVGPYTGNRIWGLTVDERHVWEPDLPLRSEALDTGVIVDGHISYIDALEGWRPDLIVSADSAWELVGHRDEFSCPKVLWGVDNHVRDYHHGGLSWWDRMFLAHHDGPALPVDDSRSDMTWLPCAYDPEYFTPSPIPMAEREYDVCMIGVMYPRRVEILEAMAATGLKVFAATGLLYEDYRDAYHNSRISLCVSAAGDVAQRVFETAAMGCVVLTDRCADFKRLPPDSAQVFGGPSGAVYVAETLLGLPNSTGILSKLASDTIEWAAPHTWDARAQAVLDTMFGGI
jgi:hypothetical protein